MRVCPPSAVRPVRERAAPAVGTAGATAEMLVVILNYNTLADTLACLGSLAGQTWRDFDVLVIDNASRGDDAARIAEAFPAAEVLALPRNLGWAGGNNVGLRRALDEDRGFVCLLNSDTVLAPEALGELAAAARLVAAPALLHPAIHFFDDPARPQLWPWADPAAPPAARALAERHDIVPMNWAYGACLLLPTALVRRVGLLDERFFLQLEEQDYFRRAQAVGARGYCARRARILHKESVSFGGRLTPAKTYYQVRNRLLLAEKHDFGPRGMARALREVFWELRNRSGAPSRLGFFRWLVSADPFAQAARQGFFHYATRRFGPRR